MKDVNGEQLYDPACTCIKCAAMRPPRKPDPEYGEEVCICCGFDKDPNVRGDWCSRCLRDQEGAMR